MSRAEKGKRRNRTDGIPSLRRWHWQPWEIHLLGHVRDSVLAELLGRSQRTVAALRQYHGIAKVPERSVTYWQLWSEAESP